MAVGIMKYTATIPLSFVFLYRKEWLTMSICAALHVILSVVIGLYVGESPIGMVAESMKLAGSLTAAGDADVASAALSLGSAHVREWAFVGYVFYGLLCFVPCFVKSKDDLLKISILAVIANVMFYHRVYDFVTLVFPFAVVLRDWCRRGWVAKFTRWATCVAIGWTFYACGILGVLHIPHNRQLMGFVLENALLVALLIQFYQKRECLKFAGETYAGKPSKRSNDR